VSKHIKRSKSLPWWQIETITCIAAAKRNKL